MLLLAGCEPEGAEVISWRVTFLSIAVVAAILGFGGISATGVLAAWLLVGVSVVFALMLGVLERGTLAR